MEEPRTQPQSSDNVSILRTVYDQMHLEMRHRRATELATLAFYSGLVTAIGAALFHAGGYGASSCRVVIWLAPATVLPLAIFTTLRVWRTAVGFRRASDHLHRAEEFLGLYSTEKFDEQPLLDRGPCGRIPGPSIWGWLSAVAYVWILWVALFLLTLWLCLAPAK